MHNAEWKFKEFSSISVANKSSLTLHVLSDKLSIPLLPHERQVCIAVTMTKLVKHNFCVFVLHKKVATGTIKCTPPTPRTNVYSIPPTNSWVIMKLFFTRLKVARNTYKVIKNIHSV